MQSGQSASTVGGGGEGRGLKAYLRAECGLLMEVAPHEVTVLPGGDLTPRGSRQGLEGAQPCRWRLLRSLVTCALFRRTSAPPTFTSPVSLPVAGNRVGQALTGEKCCPEPAAHEHPPALGANAARPACYDTVHVRVVSMVPCAVFGADLGKKKTRGSASFYTHTDTQTETHLLA